MPPFERTEYADRLARTKAAMAEQGIEVHLAANPANMCWLTGYDGWSFYVPQLVVVALDADEPIWIGRGMDANAARVTTFLKPENIISYPDDYVQNPAKHAMNFVAGFLKEKGWDKCTVGTEMDAYYYSARGHAALVADLPNATFADTTTLVNWCRVVKSDREIAYMRDAAQIIENMIRTAYDVIEPGTRQCDAAAAIHKTQIEGTAEFGGEYSAIAPMLPTGVGTSTPHLNWNDQPFQTGEATILELAGSRNRYHCPMSRTLHLGTPPQKLADTAKVVIEGIDIALDAAKPGALCQDVEAAWARHINAHGVFKDSRMGYSIGLAYPPDWGEHTLSLRPGDETVLRAGMTIHLMPGIWLDDWGVEISEPLLVTEKGAETFCNFPRELFVKN